MWRRLLKTLRIDARLPSDPIRPKVTPDPTQAAQLRQRQERIAYAPENGLHRDREQPKLRVVR